MGFILGILLGFPGVIPPFADARKPEFHLIVTGNLDFIRLPIV
jgi:hypothetical protein